MDVLAYPTGQGRMKLLALVKDPASIARYLARVGEATEVPFAKLSPRRCGVAVGGAGACKLARPEGIEPPASWFEAKRSIQVSYGRVETNPSTRDAEANSFRSGSMGTSSSFRHCNALQCNALQSGSGHPSAQRPAIG